MQPPHWQFITTSSTVLLSQSVSTHRFSPQALRLGSARATPDAAQRQARYNALRCDTPAKLPHDESSLSSLLLSLPLPLPLPLLSLLLLLLSLSLESSSSSQLRLRPRGRNHGSACGSVSL